MPTLRDVARAAGVSTTTASDALAGRGRITAATRERIAAAARDLGYLPNLAARNLRRGRTGAIGLRVPERTAGLTYYMELAIGAAERAHAEDAALTLLPTGSPPRPGLHVDGVVVADPALGDPGVAALAAAGLPVVTCERDLTPGAAHAGTVESDHAATAVRLLDHLAARGARRTAVLAPGTETAYGHDLRAAHERWCAERSVPPLVRDVGLASDPVVVAGAVAELLGSAEPPDALLVVPDGSATPALEAVRARGLHPPGDLLFAAYADGPVLRALQVTAVDLAAREMGRRLAGLLLDVLAGRRPPGTREVLPLQLVERASSAR
ncbi:LacI family DNA-binding transcriptional regulator [Kineococcus glutinatus]|uniref:Substrate-binding domain-containing protein n=1 Tax=Kineococcus glutinatus TaxID=1070872 RepID=A0ABP9HJ42_9ACTN